MEKYLNATGLTRVFRNVQNMMIFIRELILGEKGRKNGIASLDDKGFVPLAQLGNLDMTFFEVVQELPTTGIKKHIYLIKNNKQGEQDTYDEYIYTGDVNGEAYDSSKWEKLGDFVPTFDLKEYAKKEDAIKEISFVPADGSTSSAGYILQTSFASGDKKNVSIPLASGAVYGGSHPSQGNDGFMSSQDKTKLDEIDLEALSQSIANANTAADNTNSAIAKCNQATSDAEKVNARLDGNVLTVTNRKGIEQSVNLTDSDEHVTVNLTTNVSGATTAGLVLYVYINNGENPLLYTADSNGQATFTVEKGATYRVVFPALEGCNPINPIQHIAAVGNRIIDAAYEAETVKLEHVTVKVRKADDKDAITPWERFNVYITISNAKTTYATDEEGKVEFDVKNGTSYTVAVDKQDGMYEQYDRYSYTRTAAADSYRFNFIYRTYEAGIWLIDDENKRWTYDEWNESGNDAKKLMFVCIKTLSTQRYNGDIYIGLDVLKDFSKTAVSRQWCSQGTLFNNIPENGQNTALSTWSEFSYNGLHATETIIAEGDDRELATPACDYAYSFKVQNGDKTYQGYLPTSYQWSTVWNNIDFVLDMLGLKFPDMTFTRTMFANSKWTSTQFNAALSYFCGTIVNNTSKAASFLAVPFFACLSPS